MLLALPFRPQTFKEGLPSLSLLSMLRHPWIGNSCLLSHCLEVFAGEVSASPPTLDKHDVVSFRLTFIGEHDSPWAACSTSSSDPSSSDSSISEPPALDSPGSVLSRAELLCLGELAGRDRSVAQGDGGDGALAAAASQAARRR